MTLKAFIKQSDMKRMASVAKEFGIRVEVDADGVFVRVYPDRPSALPAYRDPGIDYSAPDL